MLFKELVRLSTPKITSLNGRVEYVLIECNRNEIIYKNKLTETIYRLTKEQAAKAEQELLKGNEVDAQQIRAHFRQSKSWVFALITQSNMFEIKQNPLRIKWSRQKS